MRKTSAIVCISSQFAVCKKRPANALATHDGPNINRQFGVSIMPLIPIRAISAQNQSETEMAWHIFAALSQYAAQHPALADNLFYTEAMREAHAHWAALFAR